MKGNAMHAVVINVSFTDYSAAMDELTGLVPRVSGAPGFVAGYWVALSQEKGTSIAVLDSEDAARGLLPMMEGGPPMSVTIDSVEVGEVVAQA
jgi:hypothetical protein